MSSEVTQLGLRERKRIATRRAIQLAAITIVRDSGLDRLTVDEIGRVADISPRTFFNYFSSKEAALIGDAPSLPSAESVKRFVRTIPILTGRSRSMASNRASPPRLWIGSASPSSRRPTTSKHGDKRAPCN